MGRRIGWPPSTSKLRFSPLPSQKAWWYRIWFHYYFPPMIIPHSASSLGFVRIPSVREKNTFPTTPPPNKFISPPPTHLTEYSWKRRCCCCCPRFCPSGSISIHSTQSSSKLILAPQLKLTSRRRRQEYGARLSVPIYMWKMHMHHMKINDIIIHILALP